MPTTRHALDLIAKNPRAFVKRIPRVPRLYAAAFGARRKVRAHDGATFEASFDFASALRWGGLKIKPGQVRDEALGLLEILARDPPRTVVEIGTLNGGTLFLWTRVAAPDAVLVTVDLFGSLLGSRSPQGIVLRSFARARQRIELLPRRNSHAESTRDEVVRRLENRPIDFLFIDGDHHYESVARDFELYGSLVRPGGLVAFHDVSPLTDPITVGVARFWEDFKRNHETEELIVPGEHVGSGIGLYRVPVTQSSAGS